MKCDETPSQYYNGQLNMVYVGKLRNQAVQTVRRGAQDIKLALQEQGIAGLAYSRLAGLGYRWLAV